MTFARSMVLWLAFSSLAASAQPEPFQFQTNDVVALTGGGNLERTRFNGSLQTLLIASRPELRLRVRNLAWEGDTVFEQWRDDAREQWRQARDWAQQLDEVEATVVFAQFGQMEALRGADNLDEFIRDYETLLDQFATGNRRLVLLSPIPFEKPAALTFPDLTARNADVQKYAAAVGELARRRGCHFLDLYTALTRRAPAGAPLTDHGLHLNERGHAVVAELICTQLGLKPKPLASLSRVREAVLEMERLWFDAWRPMNWSFLEGDRTHVPFSRDWRDQEKRLFAEEMKEFAPLLQQADENIWRALAGQAVLPVEPRSPMPVEPPTVAPQNPDQELATFQIDPRFEVNLFASEQDGIVNPIQMRWDERGRLWVACTVSYPQIKPGEKANDYIMVCEDTDGDGRADQFTRFAAGLFMPSGLELGDGGLYVAQGTELLHLRDTNGDGRADQQRIVMGGFGTADSHQMINCLSWGFSGELWFTQGHHIYSRVETPYGIERLNRAGVWRFRPRTLRLDAFFNLSSAGQNDWGVITDDYGQVFHKSGATIGGYYSVPGLIRSALFVDSEPMRIFQARAKQVGIEMIGSAHFPEELQGRFILGGYYESQLQLYQLDYRDGFFSSQQLPAIIETTNSVFRPVEVRGGPDGALYVADWYNPIIGHYQASYRHPDRDQSHGRIWRVTYKGGPLVKPPTLAGASIPELLNHLDSPERWVKYQAKRLLFERNSAQVVAALDDWIKRLPAGEARDEYRRLQALSLYEAHEAPRPALLASLLRSPDFRVRAYATRALGQWNHRVPDGLKLLEQQARDEHQRVRLETVVAASYFADSTAMTIAARVLDQRLDPYLDHALVKAIDVLAPHWEPALKRDELKFARDEHLLFVLQKSRLEEAPAIVREFIARTSGDPAKQRRWLTALVSVGTPEDLRFVLDRAGADLHLLDALAAEAEGRKAVPAGDVKAVLERLLADPDEAMRRRGVRLAGLWRTAALAGPMRLLAEDEQLSDPLRIEAFQAIARLRGRESVALLTNAITQARTPAIAMAALEALTRASLPEAAQFTVKQLAVVTNTTAAAQWLRPVLQSRNGFAVLTRALPDGALSPSQARLALMAINNSGRYDQGLAERLSHLAGFSADLPVYSPEYIRELAEAAQRSGSVRAGQKVYELLGCASCHVIDGEGSSIGPDLSALGRGLPLDGIITELIWPRLNVKEGYEATSIITRDGRLIEGMKASETAEEIAIRDTLSNEVTRIRRSQIDRHTAGGSVMPEGLTTSLSRQQLIDLIRYLAELGQ